MPRAAQKIIAAVIDNRPADAVSIGHEEILVRACELVQGRRDEVAREMWGGVTDDEGEGDEEEDEIAREEASLDEKFDFGDHEEVSDVPKAAKLHKEVKLNPDKHGFDSMSVHHHDAHTYVTLSGGWQNGPIMKYKGIHPASKFKKHMDETAKKEN